MNKKKKKINKIVIKFHDSMGTLSLIQGGVLIQGWVLNFFVPINNNSLAR